MNYFLCQLKKKKYIYIYINFCVINGKLSHQFVRFNMNQFWMDGNQHGNQLPLILGWINEVVSTIIAYKGKNKVDYIRDNLQEEKGY